MTRYQVALSFAGEDRTYVEGVAEYLRAAGVTVFYDKYEVATLWGKDLYVHLREVYQDSADYTIMFISEHYAKNAWTTHERQGAQARAFQENREYILPARFDDTVIPGLPSTIGFIDLRGMPERDFAAMVVRKLELARAQSGTALSNLSNHDLVLKTFELVGRIREVVHEFERDEHERRVRTMYRSTSDAQWADDMERQTREHDVATLRLKQHFELHFKVDALLLEAEMTKRLPPSPAVPRERYATHYYEYVASPYDLRRVIEDLEKLAKSLPSRT